MVLVLQMEDNLESDALQVRILAQETQKFSCNETTFFSILGVGTKDDQQKQNGSSENGGDIKKDNGSMGSSNSKDVGCLKLRLRSKFRSAAAQGYIITNKEVQLN